MRQINRFPHPSPYPFPPEPVSLSLAHYLSFIPTRLDPQTGSLAIRALETIAPPRTPPFLLSSKIFIRTIRSSDKAERRKQRG